MLHYLFFSFDLDGHFEDSIVDKGFDVDKIVQTQMMLEAVRDALSKLNDEEREIIDRLYFNDETLRSVAERKRISHPTFIKRRNKILEKLRELLKDFKWKIIPKNCIINTYFGEEEIR